MKIFTFKQEIYRKLFHLSASIFPYIYYYLSKVEMLFIIAFSLAFVFLIDLGRFYNPMIRNIVNNFMGGIIRPYEQHKIGGVTFLLSGFLISALFFEKNLAIISWMVLIISDMLAAIIGKQYGSPLKNGKSIIGSLAFFISSIMTMMICNYYLMAGLTLWIIVVSSLISTLLEFTTNNTKINDNLSIPLSICCAIKILSW